MVPRYTLRYSFGGGVGRNPGIAATLAGENGEHTGEGWAEPLVSKAAGWYEKRRRGVLATSVCWVGVRVWRSSFEAKVRERLSNRPASVSVGPQVL